MKSFVQKKIGEMEERLSDLDFALKKHFERKDALNASIREAKEERDNLHQEARDLVTKGKAHIERRNAVQKEIKTLKDSRTDIRKAMDRKASELGLSKTERDKLNIVAKGRSDLLKKRLEGSMRTLMETDLSLKNELIMVEMILELQERLGASIEADGVHTKVQERYSELKDIQSQLDETYKRVGELIMESNTEHEAAMTAFSQKDDVRNRAQDEHHKMIDCVKELKDLELEITAQKLAVGKVRDMLRQERRKLRMHPKRIEALTEKDRLKEAKKKVEKAEKLNMQDLKLLLDKGELDLKKKGK